MSFRPLLQHGLLSRTVCRWIDLLADGEGRTDADWFDAAAAGDPPWPVTGRRWWCLHSTSVGREATVSTTTLGGTIPCLCPFYGNPCPPRRYRPPDIWCFRLAWAFLVFPVYFTYSSIFFNKGMISQKSDEGNSGNTYTNIIVFNPKRQIDYCESEGL